MVKEPNIICFECFSEKALNLYDVFEDGLYLTSVACTECRTVNDFEEPIKLEKSDT